MAKRRFQLLASNEQGFPEYEDTLTGITFVCIPADTDNGREEYWIGKTPVTCGQYQIFWKEATEPQKTEFLTDAYDLCGGDAWLATMKKYRTNYTYKDDRYEEEYFATRSELFALLQWNKGSFASEWTEYNEYHPVIGVSWLEAFAFCKWAGYELPTEAQWGKAAGSKDRQRLYPWGNEEPDAKDSQGSTVWRCNFQEYSLNRTTGTTPVFSLENGKPVLDEKGRLIPTFPLGASPYGILDMGGNVWEWCLDWYDEYGRSCRGGSWRYSREAIQVSRLGIALAHRDIDLGFRVCNSPADSRL